jgi:hypothetical protein
MTSLDPQSINDKKNLWLPTISDVGHRLLEFGFNLDLVRSWGDRECYELQYKYFVSYYPKTKDLSILGEYTKFNCKINSQEDIELVLKDLKNNNINVQ